MNLVEQTKRYYCVHWRYCGFSRANLPQRNAMKLIDILGLSDEWYLLVPWRYCGVDKCRGLSKLGSEIYLNALYCDELFAASTLSTVRSLTVSNFGTKKEFDSISSPRLCKTCLYSLSVFAPKLCFKAFSYKHVGV